MRRLLTLAGPALLLFLLPLAACQPTAPAGGQTAGLELIVLHSNDTHAAAAGIDRHGNPVWDQTTAIGGAARLAAYIDKTRRDDGNVLVLDAGDQFQGTLLYTVNKWRMQADLNDHLHWDGATLGNHEWDEGCAELLAFLKRSRVPVLAANLAPEQGCPLYRSGTWRPWAVFEKAGEQVGVIGLCNDETPILHACEHTRFTDARATLEQAVQTLEAMGVRHIIALTHLGIDRDRELARSVDGVDVIVGGHSHTFLGPGSTSGPCPIVERSPSGQPVLVVTAWRSGRYVGELDVVFDRAGVPMRWSGRPVELTADMPRDPSTARVVDDYVASVDRLRATALTTNELNWPDGMDVCRAGECLSGMVATDAMLRAARAAGAVIAVTNSGGVRAALPGGTVSLGDVMQILACSNPLHVRDYQGSTLRAALEHGAARYPGPALLQVSGLRCAMDMSRPAGNRVTRIDLVDADGRLTPFDDKAVYRVVLPEFLVNGGNGYVMLKGGREIVWPMPMDADAMADYLKGRSTLAAPGTGRLIITGR